jgi:hypothetical protein
MYEDDDARALWIVLCSDVCVRARRWSAVNTDGQRLA